MFLRTRKYVAEIPGQTNHSPISNSLVARPFLRALPFSRAVQRERVGLFRHRITNVTDIGAAYTYDGNSFRVKKTYGGVTTTYIFSGTKPIAEYIGGSITKEYIYSGENQLAEVAYSGLNYSVTYKYPDQLSTRDETDASGNLTRTFGHVPFGETWYETGTSSKWKFTTYERDSETNNDYATFRYHENRLGRFMTTDPL